MSNNNISITSPQQQQNWRASMKAQLEELENNSASTTTRFSQQNLQQQQPRRSDVIELTPIPRNSGKAILLQQQNGGRNSMLLLKEQQQQQQLAQTSFEDINDDELDLQTARRSRRLQQQQQMSARNSTNNVITTTRNSVSNLVVENQNQNEQQQQLEQDSAAPVASSTSQHQQKAKEEEEDVASRKSMIVYPLPEDNVNHLQEGEQQNQQLSSPIVPSRKSVTFAPKDDVVEFGNSANRASDATTNATASTTRGSSSLRTSLGGNNNSSNNNTSLFEDDEEGQNNHINQQQQNHVTNTTDISSDSSFDPLLRRYTSVAQLKKATGKVLLDYIRDLLAFDGSSRSHIEIPRIHSARVTFTMSLLKRHGYDLEVIEAAAEKERTERLAQLKKEREMEVHRQKQRCDGGGLGSSKQFSSSSSSTGKTQQQLWEEWQRQNCNPLAVLARPKNYDMVQQQLRQNALKNQQQKQQSSNSNNSETKSTNLRHVPLTKNNGSNGSFVQPTMKFGGHHQRIFTSSSNNNNKNNHAMTTTYAPRERFGIRRQRGEQEEGEQEDDEASTMMIMPTPMNSTKTAVAFSVPTSGFMGPSSSFSTNKMKSVMMRNNNNNTTKNHNNNHPSRPARDRSENSFIQGAREIMTKVPQAVSDGTIASLPSSELDFFLSRKLPLGTDLPRLKKDKIAACIRICS